MTFKKRKIMFNVWFPSYGFVFQLIHNIPKFSLDLCCVTLLRICRQIAQIEWAPPAPPPPPSKKKKGEFVNF